MIINIFDFSLFHFFPVKWWHWYRFFLFIKRAARPCRRVCVGVSVCVYSILRSLGLCPPLASWPASVLHLASCSTSLLCLLTHVMWFEVITWVESDLSDTVIPITKPIIWFFLECIKCAKTSLSKTCNLLFRSSSISKFRLNLSHF